MLRQILLLLSGNAATAALSLARNLLVARMISVEDYGIAALFALVMSLVEMGTNLGLEAQIVQAREGDEPYFQAQLQGLALLRGGGAALVLATISPLLARLAGLPDLTTAFVLLAAVPLLGGLTHLDIHRLTRARRFRPLMLTNALPLAASVAALWPLSVLGDWRIMLGAILLQATLRPVLSHVLAERRYSLVFAPAAWRASLGFGLPIMANAALMFIVFQGDRVVVAQALGLVALGVFSMGVTLALTPTLVFDRAFQSYALGPLAKAETARMRDWAILAPVAAGLGFATAMTLLAAPLVALLLGKKYGDLTTILPFLALWAGLRMAKTGPSTLALARGQTGNALGPNLLRALSLPVAFLLAKQSGQVMPVIWVSIVAEALGFILAMAILQRRGKTVLPLRGLMVLTGGYALLTFILASRV